MKYNKLDLDDPVDKALKTLIDMNLVQLFANDDTGETLVTLTDEGQEAANKMLKNLNADDVNDVKVQKFLDSTKKMLDTLSGK